MRGRRLYVHPIVWAILISICMWVPIILAARWVILHLIGD